MGECCGSRQHSGWHCRFRLDHFQCLCDGLSCALPGRNGATKGLTFGLIGWIFMGLIFFPLIGIGPFGIRVGLGIYSVVLRYGVRHAQFNDSLNKSARYDPKRLN